jgi:AcrR family transcriptional regulator
LTSLKNNILDIICTFRYSAGKSEREIETVDNREKIIAEALSLFADRGYDAVGVQEIANSAGITKPTLYHYFGNKLGLLKAILEENFQPLLKRVGPAAADYKGDLPLTLYRLAGAYIGFAKEYPGFYRLQLALWFAPKQSESFRAVLGWGERQQKLLEDLFQRASQDHGNMKGRHRRYAVTFLGMVNTLIGLGFNDLTDLNEEMVFNTVHQFMHGIYS